MRYPKDLTPEEQEFFEIIGEDFGINDPRQIYVLIALLLSPVILVAGLIFLIRWVL